MTRDQAVAEAARAIREQFPDRADEILRALEQPSVALEVYENLVKTFDRRQSFGDEVQFEARLHRPEMRSHVTRIENAKRAARGEPLLPTPEEIAAKMAAAAAEAYEVDERLDKVFAR